MPVVPIIPSRNFDYAKRHEKAIRNFLAMTAKAIEVDYKTTTRTWKTAVKFTNREDNRGGDWARVVGTNNEIYTYVHEGTRPHIIRPRNFSALRFQEGYKAKTKPGFIGSSSGGSYGRYVYAREVRHPGTRGRKFSVSIARKWQRQTMAQWNRALRASGL